MPASIIDIVKSGFTIVTKNKIVFLPLTILTIFSTIFTFYYFGYPSSMFNGAVVTPTLFAMIASIGLVIFSLFVHLWTMHLTYSAVRRKVSLESSAKIASKSFFKFVIATILYGLIVFGGFILLIIPGIILSIRLLFYPYAIILDNSKAVDSLKRSWRITKGRWWKTFGISFLIGLITLLVILPIYFAVIFIYRDLVLATILVDIIAIFFSAWSIATYTSAYLKFKK